MLNARQNSPHQADLPTLAFPANPRLTPFLFGKVKIWGEIVEHEAGYRSEFGKIVSLDYGDPILLNKFRRTYGLEDIVS